MSNFVTNRVMIKKDIIEKYLSKDEDGDEFLDFNKLIPMPDSLNLPARGIEHIAIKSSILARTLMSKEVPLYTFPIDYPFYKLNISTENIKKIKEDFSPTEDMKRLNIKTLEDLGDAYLNNIKKYGYSSWYDWCSVNWNTKWNSTPLIERSDNVYEFDTAWRCPIPIFEKISELHPEELFEVEYADENIGDNCGRLVFFEGKLIKEFYPKNSVEFALDVKGINPEEYYVTLDDDGYKILSNSFELDK